MLKIKKVLVVPLAVVAISMFGSCTNLKTVESVSVVADKVWTDGVLSPESVLVDGETLYISNVGAKNSNDFFMQPDYDGYIQTIVGETSTRITDSMLLHGPKGSVIINGVLYCNDVYRVVGISLESRKIVFELDLSTVTNGVRFANDMLKIDDNTLLVTVADKGLILKVDIKSKRADIFAKLDGANGIEMVDGVVFINQFKQGADGSPKGKVGCLKDTTFVPFDFVGEGLWDGMVHLQEKLFLVSDWATNSVYVIDLEQKVKKAIITGINGPADICFDRKKSILYVPAMVDDKILSYKVSIK